MTGHVGVASNGKVAHDLRPQASGAVCRRFTASGALYPRLHRSEVLRISTVDFIQAVQGRNRDVATRALAEMARHMPSKVRLTFALASPFLRSWSIVRIAHAARFMLRFVLWR
jgi:hypothetical protein